MRPVSLKSEEPPVVMPTAGPVAPPEGMGIVTGVHEKHLDTKMLLAIVFSAVGFAMLVAALLFVWVYRRVNRRRVESKGTSSTDFADSMRGHTLPPILSKFNSSVVSGRKGSVAIFEYAFLEAATSKFDDRNIIGEGGFGRVYKANLAEGIVAVKKISSGGLESEQEFENEVDLLGKIQHPNIVSLLGYCIPDQMRFIVYEFMQNGSLEMQLHGPSHGSAMNWHIRMKIALDTARGLEYLHEHCNPSVIHRDFKSSNILLDSEFNAKISDFGLAVTGGNQNKGGVKMSGTLGYVAPEYLLDGILTEKSDVYAFGVVLLELLMGRKPVEKTAPSQCQFIVTWAMPQLTDRTKLPNIVDPVIRGTMDLKHLYQVAAVAVLCVQPEPSYRPLITDVLHSLIPLVPMELGGSLRISESSGYMDHKHQCP